MCGEMNFFLRHACTVSLQYGNELTVCWLKCAPGSNQVEVELEEHMLWDSVFLFPASDDPNLVMQK